MVEYGPDSDAGIGVFFGLWGGFGRWVCLSGFIDHVAEGGDSGVGSLGAFPLAPGFFEFSCFAFGLEEQQVLFVEEVSGAHPP